MIILVIIYIVIVATIIILAKTDKQEIWKKGDIPLMIVPIVNILFLLCLLKFRLDILTDKFLTWINTGKEVDPEPQNKSQDSL